MQYLSAPLVFGLCAAIGFWAIMKILPKRSKPPEARETTPAPSESPPWDGGNTPHQFGSRGSKK
ncbi:hypothetical protein [Asaia sp. VD9]|uniref:hypothetical protein n=1 Tax=Asaia sp. VD9 TaxID=3081235 RepID=UPI00301A1A91